METLSKRDLNTYNNLNYEIEKNDVIKSLFELGFRTRESVFALLSHFNEEYKSVALRERFKMFWLGRTRDAGILSDLNKLINNINSK